jgi:hypothetical protein
MERAPCRATRRGGQSGHDEESCDSVRVMNATDVPPLRIYSAGARYSRLNVKGPTLHVTSTLKTVSDGAAGSRLQLNLWTLSVTVASRFAACRS